MSVLLVRPGWLESEEAVRLTDAEFREFLNGKILEVRERRLEPDYWFRAEYDPIHRRKHNRERLYEERGGRCYLCGEFVASDDFHVDHVVPLARGGKDEWGNLEVAHPACNLRKGASLVAELDWVVCG